MIYMLIPSEIPYITTVHENWGVRNYVNLALLPQPVVNVYNDKHIVPYEGGVLDAFM